MAEYIIEIPDEYLPKFYGHVAYYPSELHNPMKISPLVRCEDCKFAGWSGRWCVRINEFDDSTWFAVEPDGFCVWGERAVISDTTETELKWTL